MKDYKEFRKRRIEDDFAPEGTKECEMKCERDVVVTKQGPVIVCHACKRIVMDNRDK
jgi:hypothetical protein